MTAESIFERELTHWVIRGVVELAMTSPLQEPILEGIDAAGFGNQTEPIDDDTSLSIDVGAEDSSIETDESTPSSEDSTDVGADSDEHSVTSTWSKFWQGITVFVVLFVALYLFLRWATKDDE